jgi:hypothetical protein
MRTRIFLMMIFFCNVLLAQTDGCLKQDQEGQKMAASFEIKMNQKYKEGISQKEDVYLLQIAWLSHCSDVERHNILLPDRGTCEMVKTQFLKEYFDLLGSQKQRIKSPYGEHEYVLEKSFKCSPHKKSDINPFGSEGKYEAEWQVDGSLQHKLDYVRYLADPSNLENVETRLREEREKERKERREQTAIVSSEGNPIPKRDLSSIQVGRKENDVIPEIVIGSSTDIESIGDSKNTTPPYVHTHRSSYGIMKDLGAKSGLNFSDYIREEDWNRNPGEMTTEELIKWHQNYNRFISDLYGSDPIITTVKNFQEELRKELTDIGINLAEKGVVYGATALVGISLTPAGAMIAKPAIEGIVKTIASVAQAANHGESVKSLGVWQNALKQGLETTTGSIIGNNGTVISVVYESGKVLYEGGSPKEAILIAITTTVNANTAEHLGEGYATVISVGLEMKQQKLNK